MISAIANLWREVRRDLTVAICVGFIGLSVLSVALFLRLGQREAARWGQFVQDHACVKVGEVSPTSSVGVGFSTLGPDGVTVVPVTTPGKTGWKCDDGVTYWR